MRITNNISRNGNFGPLAKLIGLANAIHDSGWLPGSSIVLTVADGEDMADAVLATMVDEANAKRREPLAAIDIAGVPLNLPISLPLPEDHADMCVVAGNRRALAVRLLLAAGVPVDYQSTCVQPEESRRVNIAENAAQAHHEKVKAIEQLASMLPDYESGAVEKEAQLIKAYNLSRMAGQTIHARAQLVLVHGFTLDEACSLNKEQARKIYQKPIPEVRAMVENGEIEGMAVSAKPKCLTRKDIQGLATLAGDGRLGSLLTAIADGKEGEAKRIIAELV